MIPRHQSVRRRPYHRQQERQQRQKRETTVIRMMLETVARIVLHDESHAQLSEEEYIHWFLSRLFTVESFFELIAFSILCFWSGGGLLFFSLIFFHVFNGFMSK